MTDQDILFRLDVDASGAITGFRLSREELTKLRQATEQTGSAATRGAGGVKQLGDATERTGRQADTTSTAMRRLQGLVAGIFTAATIRQAISYADTMNLIEARLRIVTDSHEEFARAQQGVFEIAQQTRTSIEATASLYTRLELALKNTTIAQDDILRVTGLVNKALLTSGATAQETSSAVIQLGQALGRGALSGEEFRSVAEAAPRIVLALQDALGKTQGELKELADQQKLTTDVVVSAILEQGAVIDAEAAKIPITVGQAFTTLRNEVLKFVADADDATEASRKIAEGVVSLSQNLDTLANVGLAAASVGLVRLAAPALASVTAALSLALAGVSRFGIGLVALNVRAAAAEAGLTLLDRTMAFLGGPIGVLITAVGLAGIAFSEYKRRAEGAKQTSDELADAIENAASRIEAADSIIAAHEAIRDRRLEIEQLREELELMAQAPDLLPSFAAQAGLSFTPDATRVDEIRQRITQLATEIAKYQAALGIAKQRGDEWGATAKSNSTAAQLLAEAMGDLDEITKSVADAYKTANKAIAEHGTVQQRVALIDSQYAATLNQLGIYLGDVAHDQETLNAATAALTIEWEQQRRAVLDSNDALVIFTASVNELLRGALDPTTVSLSQLEVQLEEVERQFGASSAEAARAREQLYNVRLAVEDLSDTEVKPPDLGPMVKAIERGIERLDDTFAELWRSIFTGAESAFDAIKNLVLNTLAELAHAAITRPIVLSIAAAVGGTGPGSAFANMGGVPGSGGLGAVSGLGSLANLFTGRSIGLGLQNLPTWLGGTNGGLMTMSGGLFGNAAAYSNLAYGGTGIIAGLLGQAIFGGHGGTGAGIGATLGLAAGGPIGALLGGLAGGALGGLFGKSSTPDLYAAGAASGARKNAFGVDTALGGLFLGHDDFDDELLPDIVSGLQQFDAAIAEILDRDQLGSVTEALKNWNVELHGEAITMEALLSSRFTTILGTFNDEVRAYVNEAEGLEQQISRLQVITALEDLMETTPGLFGSLTEAAAALEDLALAGETLPDTFVRVAASMELLRNALDLIGSPAGGSGADFLKFAADFTQAAGGIDRASQLWGAYFDNFYEANEILEGRLSVATRRAVDELGDIGVSPGVTGEQFRGLFESALPTLSADALVQWLEAADALGLVIDLERQLTAARLEGLTVEDAVRMQIELVDALTNAYDGSAESQRRLLTATSTLADLMDDLQASFEAARQTVSGITGSAITQLRRENLSDDQLFAELRGQALAKSELLKTAGSQADVVALTREITQLVQDARGLVDGTGLNTELISFLQTVDQIAQLRLGELEAVATARAQAEIDQVEAIFTFTEAVGTFADAVGLIVGSDGRVPGSTTGPVETGPELTVAVSDAIASGFNASGFGAAAGSFGTGAERIEGAAGTFERAARALASQPPSVTVRNYITIDQSGRVTSERAEVSLA